MTASKTVAVGVERLCAAVVEASARRRWLPDDQLSLRTATAPRSARFDWAGGRTRVNVGFVAKGPAKSALADELAGAAESEAQTPIGGAR